MNSSGVLTVTGRFNRPRSRLSGTYLSGPVFDCFSLFPLVFLRLPVVFLTVDSFLIVLISNCPGGGFGGPGGGFGGPGGGFLAPVAAVALPLLLPVLKPPPGPPKLPPGPPNLVRA